MTNFKSKSQPSPQNFHFFFKVKKNFCLGAFFLLWGMSFPLPKKAINIPRTHEKLHCKGEPYRFSCKRDSLVHTDPVIFILGFIFLDVIDFYRKMFNIRGIFLILLVANIPGNRSGFLTVVQVNLICLWIIKTFIFMFFALLSIFSLYSLISFLIYIFICLIILCYIIMCQIYLSVNAI